LIADGSGARILETLGSGHGFHEQGSSGARQRATEPLAAGSGRRDVGERPRATKALQSLFAKQLGTMLTGYLRDDAFDRLVLVAPGAMLDELRKMISPAVQKKVVIEIERDLTDIPTNELPVYLGDVVSF